MSNEIRLAFEHPAARADATAPDGPLDRISVRDHIVEVEIGAFQSERGRTQRVAFNVVVEVRPLCDPIDDDVDRILSYDKVTEAIEAALAEERLNLLETLAERIAERILWEPRALRTFVRVEKLDRGPGALGVEIVRSATDVRTRPRRRSPAPRRARMWSIWPMPRSARPISGAGSISFRPAPSRRSCASAMPRPRRRAPATA